MNELQLEGVKLDLTKLIGKKELSFGCLVKNFGGEVHKIGNGEILKDRYSEGAYFWITITEIIGHPATISDFHRYVNYKHFQWKQLEDVMYIIPDKGNTIMIMYNSSKDLLDQDESILKQIIELISSNQ